MFKCDFSTIWRVQFLSMQIFVRAYFCPCFLYTKVVLSSSAVQIFENKSFSDFCCSHNNQFHIRFFLTLSWPYFRGNQPRHQDRHTDSLPARVPLYLGQQASASYSHVPGVLAGGPTTETYFPGPQIHSQIDQTWSVSLKTNPRTINL